MKGARTLPWRYKAKNQREAKERYFRFLRRSLGCVSNVDWYVASVRGSKTELVALTNRSSVPLTCSDESLLFLRLAQNFHYEPHPDFPGEWKVKTDRYEYSLSRTETFENELLAFHWHPGSDPTTPHVHVALEGHPNFHKAHVPTRRIFLEDVVRLVIEDFGVEPLCEDWAERLGDATDRVREFGSWR
ncbi:MAG: hypothetical protein M3391_09215 [Actinomycetota bacterium]|nr:hypothetical protein [Actinomycetota bacterium]